MNERDLFGRIVASLHEATFDDAHWPAISALIDQACGAKGNNLLLGSGHTRPTVQLLFTRFCAGGERRVDREKEYFGIYYPVDERVPRVRSLPDSRLVHIDDLYTEKEKKTSRAYNECLPDTECQDSLLVRLDVPDGSRIVWNIADPIDGGGWRSTHLETIQRLLPHVRHFVVQRQALIEAGALGSSLARLLDNTNCGVIQLNRHGKIVDTNDSARELLRQRDGLMDRSGFLAARDLSDDARLQALLEDALPNLEQPPTAGSTTIGRPDMRPCLVVHASPVSELDTASVSASVAAIVIVVDPGAESRVDPVLVQEVLGLTRAETRVALSLASGDSIREIAQSTRRGESTVRWHIKHIFEKQGITRQAQLVRRVQALNGL